MKSIIVLLMLLLVITGCSTTGHRVQWYAGPRLGADRPAILKVERNFGGINLRVDAINGERLDKGKRFRLNDTSEIELLPGYYVFSVAYSDSNGAFPLSDGAIGFTAGAGKVYEMRGAREDMSFGKSLELTTFGGHFTASVWIIDSETGKAVAGAPRKTPLHGMNNSVRD